MARYKIGDIIKIKRLALGISQEELCFGICEQHTLSNIENGKCKVKQQTYSELMDRLNQYGSKSYGLIRTDNYEMLQITEKIAECLFNREYIAAQELLDILKKDIDLSYNINKQYIMSVENTIKYDCNMLDIEDYYNSLMESIKLTIPHFDEIDISEWAFTEHEFQILIYIAALYKSNHEYENAKSLLLKLKLSLDKMYLDNIEFAKQYSLVINNLADILGNEGNHQEAINYSYEALEICKKNKVTSMICYLLGEIAWNIEQLTKKGIIDISEEKTCLDYYEKAYYLSFCRKDAVMTNFLINRCREKYPDKLNLL